MEWEEDDTKWIADFNKALELREDVVTLIDEDGIAQRFEVLDLIEVDEETYAVVTPLRPLEEEEEVIEVYVFRFEEEELVDIEDEEEFNMLLEILKELYTIEGIQ